MPLYSKNFFLYVPDFVEVQRKSFFNFLEFGLREELMKRNPLQNIEKGFELRFYPEFYKLKAPKYSPIECIFKGKTYDCELYLPIQFSELQNKKTTFKWFKLANLPFMTKRGHFIINGIPRVVLNQLSRCPGIYYHQIYQKNKTSTYYADLIPQRGTWLRLEMDKKERIWVRLKKTPKISILIFLQSMGLSKEIIFQSVCSPHILEYSLLKEKHPNTLEKSQDILRSLLYRSSNSEETQLIQKFFFRKFYNPRTYNLGKIGRENLNKKLGLSISKKNLTLTPQDVLAATNYLLKLHAGIETVDDIDNLKNRRLKTSGELLQNLIETGLMSIEKRIKKKDTTQINSFSYVELTSLMNRKLIDFFGCSPLSQFMDQTNPLAEITHKRRLTSLGPGGVSRETAGMAVRGIHPSHYGRICPIETPEGQNAGLVNSLTTCAKVSRNGSLQTPFYTVYKSQVQTQSSPVYFSVEQEQDVTIAAGDLKISQLNFFSKKNVPVRTANEFKRVSTQKVNYMAISPLQMISVATALIPFLEHDDANRALMGSNMQRQAIPLLVPEAPLVSTGLESRVVSDSGHIIQANQSGYISYVSGQQIILEKRFKQNLQSFSSSIKLEPELAQKNKKKIFYLNSYFWLFDFLKNLKNQKNQKTFSNKILQSKNKSFALINKVPILKLKRFNDFSFLKKKNQYFHGQFYSSKNNQSYFFKFNKKNFLELRFFDFNLLRKKYEKNILFSRFRQLKIDATNQVLSTKRISSHQLKIDENQPINLGINFQLMKTKKDFILFDFFKNSQNQTQKYKFQNYLSTNQETFLIQKPLVQEGDWVEKGDFLTDGANSVRGALALGKNILIGYMPWEGYNFEDAIVISDRLVRDDVFTSLHIQSYTVEIQETELGLEQITNQIPEIDNSELNHLDEKGIVKIGSWVQEGDILVGKVTPRRKKELSPHEKLLYDIVGKSAPTTRNSSLRVPPGVKGRVVHIEILEPQNIDKHFVLDGPGHVDIYIAQRRKIQIGDKLAGRHGNKGVVSLILPIQDMPYLPDGTPLDMILNPLGVPSRMNVGQIFECLLGLAAFALQENYKIFPFDEVVGPEASRSLVYSKLYKARKETGCSWLFDPEHPGKVKICDGRTGNFFDQPVTVGQAYMLKLAHLVDKKIHARSTGPYALVTQQPLGGRAKRGGQRLGEMEVWALEGYGAAYTLQELFTVKSDDIIGRKKVSKSLLYNKAISFGTPESFKVLVRELQCLCLDIGIFGLDSFSKRKEIDIMKIDK